MNHEPDPSRFAGMRHIWEVIMMHGSMIVQAVFLSSLLCLDGSSRAQTTSGKTGKGQENKMPQEFTDLGKAHLRIARPSDDLTALVKFYRDGLGFDALFEFKDHDGFDGVMLGRK